MLDNSDSAVLNRVEIEDETLVTSWLPISAIINLPNEPVVVDEPLILFEVVISPPTITAGFEPVPKTIAEFAEGPVLNVRPPRIFVNLPNSVPPSFNMMSPPSPSSVMSPAVSIPPAPISILPNEPVDTDEPLILPLGLTTEPLMLEAICAELDIKVFDNSDSAAVTLVEKLALGVVNEPEILEAICAELDIKVFDNSDSVLVTLVEKLELAAVNEPEILEAI